MKASRFLEYFLESKQSGASLLATVFALGVTIIVISAFTTSFSNKAFMVKQLNSQQKFEDLHQLLATSIVSRFNTYVDNTCLYSSGGVGKVFNSVPISGAKLKFTRKPKAGGFNVPGSALSNSLKRCSKVVEKSPNNLGAKHYHFCLELEKDNAAPKNSFLGSDFGLVEVTIKPFSSISNKPISCNILQASWATPTYASLRVYYRAFWGQSANAKKFRYFKRDGQFIASATNTN